MSEEKKELAQEENTSTPQQSSSADLNISDLVALKSIIEVASQRGAFKAAELEAVGKTFNKLNNFLDSVSKKET
jgi:Cdc6-like AAA superfamily ATPase